MKTLSKRHGALALLVAVLALPAIACGGSSEATTQPAVVKTATTESPSTAATEPLATAQVAAVSPTEPPQQQEAPKETFLGDVVEQGGAYIQTLKIEDPAKPGMLYTESSGKKLVAVEVIIGNASADSVSVNPLYASLLDSEGFAYELELAGVDDQIDSLNLGKGEQVRGWLAFELPTEANPASLKYKEGLFSDGTIQVGLSTPPAGHVATVLATPRTVPQLAKIGDVVELGGISLSATRVDDPATPGVLYSATDGTRLVGVEVVLGNLSQDKVNANPLYFYLVDTNGFVYSAELGVANEQLDSIELAKSEKVKGVVALGASDFSCEPTSAKQVTRTFQALPVRDSQ
jgi:hypothetical protein